MEVVKVKQGDKGMASTKKVPYSVYVWAEKKTGVVRYVGQTNNVARRTVEHLSLKGDNILFNKFIIDHVAQGILPEIYVVQTCATREQAIKMERRHANIHRDTIYNLQ